MSGSKSSSSTASSTSSATYDNRVAADAGAIVLSGGSSLEQLSDDVAIATIKAATDMTDTGAKLAATINSDALGTVRDVYGDALKFADNTQGQVAEISEKAVDAVRETTSVNSNLASDLATLVARNSNPDAATSENLVKYGAAAVIALAVVFLIAARRPRAS